MAPIEGGKLSLGYKVVVKANAKNSSAATDISARHGYTMLAQHCHVNVNGKPVARFTSHKVAEQFAIELVGF